MSASYTISQAKPATQSPPESARGKPCERVPAAHLRSPPPPTNSASPSPSAASVGIRSSRADRYGLQCWVMLGHDPRLLDSSSGFEKLATVPAFLGCGENFLGTKWAAFRCLLRYRVSRRRGFHLSHGIRFIQLDGMVWNVSFAYKSDTSKNASQIL